MAKSVLDIVIRFAKEGDADKDSIRALQNIKTSVSSAMVALGAMAGVATTLSGVVVGLTNVFKEYSFQVEDLSRLTGTSAEEASRLIQVADDMRISYEGLQKALWFASKSGVEVNIESLARLADQYSGLNSATERATFLNKTFGRGGAELGRLMELQGDGIRSSSAAVDESLVLTAESIQKAKELYRAQDELADSWRGLTTAVGGLLAEPLAQNLSIWADLITAINQEARDGNPLFNWLDVLKGLAQLRIDQHLSDIAGTAADAADGLGGLDDAIDPAKVEDYKNAMSDLRTMISGDLGKAYENHIQKIADLNLEMENARSGKDKGEIQAQIDAETAAYERQTNAILFNIQSQAILQQIQAQPEMAGEAMAVITSLAGTYGLLDERTMGAVNSTNNLIALWMTGAITEEQFEEGMRKMGTTVAQAQEEVSEAAIAAEKQGTATGGVTTAAAGAKEPLDNMATAMHENGVEADYAKGEINGVKQGVEQLDGMTATVTIIVNTIEGGGGPSFATNKLKGGGISVGTGGAFGKGFYSSGGQWEPGNWALVGDMPGGGIGPYTEAIDPWGYIHSARETRMLARLGMLKGARSLYVPEGTGSSYLDSLPTRRGRRPSDDSPFLSPGLRETDFGTGAGGGGEVATLSEVIAPLQESAAVTGQAAFAASRSADMQAEQSARQTDVLRDGNAQIVEKLDQLLRLMPQAMQDAVKLVV